MAASSNPLAACLPKRTMRSTTAVHARVPVSATPKNLAN